MKFIPFFIFLCGLSGMSACSSGSWPDADQDKFREECAAEGGSRSYCNCYLEKMMEHFPNVSDAEQLDFETAVELSKDCE